MATDEWTLRTQRAYFNLRFKELRRALKLQAAEYERRLQDLNNENDRVNTILKASVTSDKFDDYKDATELALKLALERQDTRISSLENWRSRAVGMGVVVALIAAALGAAVVKVIIG